MSTYTKDQLLEAADILDRAHDVILAEGWWPGIAMGPNSDLANEAGHCMESAVNVVCGETHFLYVQNCSTFSARTPGWLVMLLRSRGVNARWNDQATEDEVFDRLRSVAKEFREESGRLV